MPEESEEHHSPYENLTTEQLFPEANEEIVLGEKLPIPYRLNTMRAAFRKLQMQNGYTTSSSSDSLEPTHLYIRMRSASFDSMDVALDDTSLVLFTFPLDHEILNDGDYYHDPSISRKEPTWHYTTIPIDYQTSLPSAMHVEVLDTLVLEVDDTLEGMGKLVNMYSGVDGLFEALEDEAFSLSGVDQIMKSRNNEPETQSSRWRPSGSVTLPNYDPVDEYRDIPVKGVKVVVNSFARIRTAKTDQFGDFSISGPRFKYSVRYTIKWEADDFDIRNGLFFQAITISDKRKSAWHRTLKKGKEELFGATFVGTHYYYYDQVSVNPPPKREFPRFVKFKIRAYDRTPFLGQDMNICALRDIANFGLVSFVLHDFQVFSKWKDDGSQKTIVDMVRTAIHENAHSSHWALDRIHFNAAALSYLGKGKFYIESWAKGVEYTLGTAFFIPHGYGVQNNWFTQGKSTNSFKLGYTPLVVDLVDPNNERARSLEERPNDYVTIPLKSVENSIKGTTNFKGMRNYLIKQHPDKEEELNELFDWYIDAVGY